MHGNSLKKNVQLRSGHWICSLKKVYLKISQNSQENTCVGDSFKIKWHRPQACNSIKRETPAYMFSCEFCEVIKTFCTAAPADCFWAVLIIVYNFKIISSSGNSCNSISSLTSHSELLIATKMLCTTNTCTMYLNKITFQNY